MSDAASASDDASPSTGVNTTGPGVDAAAVDAAPPNDDSAVGDMAASNADSGVGDMATANADASSHDASAGDVVDASKPDGSGIVNSHTGSWRIMPLGDSITGSTCYPQLLSKELIAKGRSNFKFIGTNLNNQSCGNGAPSLQTEGHGGYDVTYLETNSPPVSGHGTLNELKTWAAEKPDVVLMQYGTNDVWNNDATASIVTAYSFVIDQFRAQNPNVIFFVAQILPMHPSGCTACEPGVEALNSQIPGWATGKTSAASPIYVVDAWSAVPQASYTPNSANTTDGVHPNPTGAQLVADVWYNGIEAKSIP